MNLRDDERGPVLAQRSEAFLYQMLSIGIDRAGSLIQEDDFGPLQYCTSNSDTLLLASRQFASRILAQREVQMRSKYLHASITNFGVISY